MISAVNEQRVVAGTTMKEDAWQQTVAGVIPPLSKLMILDFVLQEIKHEATETELIPVLLVSIIQAAMPLLLLCC